MGIKTISHIYKETRSIAYATSRLKADNQVNEALDSKLAHENQWKRKFSITSYADNALNNALEMTPNADNPAKKLDKIKDNVKNQIAKETMDYWSTRIKSLIVQGRFLDLLHEEESNVSWKSIIYSLPKGVLQFAVNSSIDSLPTFANLKRWGKRSTAKCDLCNTRETLCHALNNCEPKLERYRWRHDNVLYYLSFIVQKLIEIEGKTDLYNVYCDLPKLNLNGQTIPPNVVPTKQIPDLVIIRENIINIVELTIPFELNIVESHQRKVDKYSSLVNDIENRNYKVFYYAIEIGSRGHINKENTNRIKTFLKSISNKYKWVPIRNNLSKLALLGSFAIYHSKNDPIWCKPLTLKPCTKDCETFKM